MNNQENMQNKVNNTQFKLWHIIVLILIGIVLILQLCWKIDTEIKFQMVFGKVYGLEKDLTHDPSSKAMQAFREPTYFLSSSGQLSMLGHYTTGVMHRFQLNEQNFSDRRLVNYRWLWDLNAEILRQNNVAAWRGYYYDDSNLSLKAAYVLLQNDGSVIITETTLISAHKASGSMKYTVYSELSVGTPSQYIALCSDSMFYYKYVLPES